MRELAHACGYSSVSGIYRFLLRLKADGKLDWEPNQSRTMRTIAATEEAV
jgi:hypothetical protein